MTQPNVTLSVSIIIPCKVIGLQAMECIEHCRALLYSPFEVLVLPDEWPDDQPIEGATVIPTGPMGPSLKRDLAAAQATGEILAFIDDDAYPRPDWLTHATRPFADDSVGAVGGPAVTPPSDGYLKAASGAVYQSWLGGGPYSYRYVPRAARDVDDYPSCNLLVRKSAFDEAGGFDSAFWPGEDTKLCLTITKELGKSIAYVPEALVYHHRRTLFKGHLKQVTGYAMHRGYFVRRFPGTSRRLGYFIPTLGTFGLLFGALALFHPLTRAAYIVAVGFYLLLVTGSSILVSWRDKRLLPMVIVGTVITHLAYGTWFLIGLLTRRLER